MTDLDKFPTSDSAKRMLTYVTRGWYDRSYVGKWIYQVIGMELDTLEGYIDSLKYQAFPETASWGMYFHEIANGMQVLTGTDIDARRKLILNKKNVAKRESMTPYRLESLIESELGIKTLITEDVDKYMFRIWVLNGISDSVVEIVGLERYVRSIKPSHLSFLAAHSIEAIYNKNQEVEKFEILNIDISIEVSCGVQQDMKEVYMIFEMDENILNSEQFYGNVLKYENLHQWNGEYSFDGTIYFDTEVVQEDL